MFVFMNRAAAETWMERQAVHAAAAGAMSIRITPERHIALMKTCPNMIQWVATKPGHRFEPTYTAADGRVWNVVFSPEPVEIMRKHISAVTRHTATTELQVAA